MNKLDFTITQEELKSTLSYDESTGVFVNIKPKRGVKFGVEAGCVHSNGYRYIMLNRRLYRAHRLAWLYVTGNWPSDLVDHLNGNKSDNRFCNLREASKSQNQHNTGRQKNNTSGYKGVSYDKSRSKWIATICHQNSKKTLGHFNTAEDAYAAYCIAAKNLPSVFVRLV